MKNKILITAMLSALSLGAIAEEMPSFNFAEVGYTTQEHDAVGGDASGFELAGSYDLEGDFYLAGSYLSTSDRGLDLGLTTFGGGYQFGLTDSTVMYAQLDYARVIFDRPNAGEFDSNGYQISVGVRSNVTEAIELKGAVKFLNAGNVDSTYGDFNPTYIELGASYLFTDELSVYADYENESDSDRYSFGLRYNF